ncbi:MAG TPA: hypothetical protein VES03_07170 [Motilibacterales bacterium]|nr:hypothetical protein [Motilibacterales bacterium]
MDDFVVDVVLEVDSRGIGVEDLARRICLPGMEILRASARGTIWLTALVTAHRESAAIRMVRDSVLAQLPDSPRSVATAVVTSAPLGDLYSRLEALPGDAQLDAIDVHDLVEQTLWDLAGVDVREVDLRPARLDSTA